MKKINSLKEYLDLNPNDIDAWFNLGDVYYENSDYNKALECYKKVGIELDPYSSEAWSNIGLMYSYIGDYDKAIEIYKKTIKLNPEDAVVYYNMGLQI